MSGHNKWSTIIHRKGAQDARRGKIFTKLIKEITISARFGGSDPNANPRLRTAITIAKSENMPKNNIERAIKKGTGELEGVIYEENTYEGYGPGGAAVLVESLTDNKNRAVAEIRHIFNKYGGNLGESGCVNWLFNKKGYLNIDKKNISENRLMEIVLDAGGEDILDSQNIFEIIVPTENFDNVRQALKQENIKYLNAEITMLPENTHTLEGKDAEKMLKMLHILEDCDDVQKIYTNADIPNKIIESF